MGIVLMMARRKLLGLFCWASSSMKMDFGWQINIYEVIETFHSVIAMLAAVGAKYCAQRRALQ